MLRGLVLTEGSAGEARELAMSLGETRFPDRLFLLASGGLSHYVVASSCRIDENEADIFDSPFT